MDEDIIYYIKSRLYLRLLLLYITIFRDFLLIWILVVLEISTVVILFLLKFVRAVQYLWSVRRVRS